MTSNFALAVDTQENSFYENFTFVTNCAAELKAQVMSIAKDLNQLESYDDFNNFFAEGDIGAWTEKFDEKGNFIGGVYYVAWGGPDIYFDTIKGTVEGGWYNDFCKAKLTPRAVDALNKFFALIACC